MRSVNLVATTLLHLIYRTFVVQKYYSQTQCATYLRTAKYLARNQCIGRSMHVATALAIINSRRKNVIAPTGLGDYQCLSNQLLEIYCHVNSSAGDIVGLQVTQQSFNHSSFRNSCRCTSFCSGYASEQLLCLMNLRLSHPRQRAHPLPHGILHQLQ